jgi:uncharacterized protein YbaP (TraB family)
LTTSNFALSVNGFAAFAAYKQTMNRTFPLADRAALLGLKLLAAINLLAFLAAMAVATIAASRVHAEPAPCVGVNLMAALKTGNAAAYARVMAEGDATLNGKSRLWRLEKADGKPSFLFGTIHMTDPRATTLPAAAQRAFDGADTVVIETTDALDQQKMAAALFKEPSLTMLPEGATLTSLLSAEDAAIVNKALDERGIPHGSVIKMQPWLLSAMVSEPACELARQSAGVPVLDAKLAKEGAAQGKAVEGLESAIEQFRAMASLPQEMNLRGLVETLKLGDKVNDVAETMLALYLQGDIGAIWPMLRAAAPGAAGDAEDYAAFQKVLIDNRNTTMAERALPMLARGNAFVAVGALHLPGPDGLVEKFREAGFTVTALE